MILIKMNIIVMNNLQKYQMEKINFLYSKKRMSHKVKILIIIMMILYYRSNRVELIRILYLKVFQIIIHK